MLLIKWKEIQYWIGEQFIKKKYILKVYLNDKLILW